MPRQFPAWSVPFYRCFMCNCYTQDGDLFDKGHRVDEKKKFLDGDEFRKYVKNLI